MIITNHARQQLDVRWPQWSPNQLEALLARNIGWKQPNGEIHLILGSAIDAFSGSTDSKLRPKPIKRGLYGVLKQEDGKVKLITVLFHTNSSVMKRAYKESTLILGANPDELINKINEVKQTTL